MIKEATFSDIVCCRDMGKLTFDLKILIKTAYREQSQVPLPLAACPMLAKINDHKPGCPKIFNIHNLRYNYGHLYFSGL